MELGKCVHGSVLQFGMGEDVLVLTSLVDMYSNMGDIGNAHRVFETMPSRNLVSWNTLISGCIRNGLVHDSFALFRKLVTSGGGFDSRIIVSLIQGCALTADLESGKILHACAIRRSFELNFKFNSILIKFFFAQVLCNKINIHESEGEVTQSCPTL